MSDPAFAADGAGFGASGQRARDAEPLAMHYAAMSRVIA
jgi:hypothetical protein